MKSNWWTLVIAVGIIGLIIFAIQWNASQSNPTPTAAEPTTNSPQTSPSPAEFTVSPFVTSTPSPAIKLETPAPTPTLNSTATPIIHIIQAGDTPYAIANRYGISVDALMATNSITDPTSLQIGQELRIPSGQSKEATAASNSIQYDIESGDTLFSLASQYGSTVDEILASNPGLEPTSLQVGQTIVIPLTRPAQPASMPPAAPNPNPNEPPPTIGSPTTGPSPSDNYELALEMINAINTERLNNGLQPLEANEQLIAVALAHAQDMVSRDYFDHVTPEGKSLRDRLQAQGLEPYWVGENIQRNTDPPDQTVQTAITWFMDSRPHRDNILHGNFTHIGTGVVEGPPGWFTFVLVFAQL